jgi:signal recognition particle receptor subunit beta
MAFGRSKRGAGEKPPADPVTLKILVAGGFGVGKTTLVGAVSEIKPLRTEEALTEASRPVDDTAGVEAKYTTTVAMDFGRITINDALVLYLFGTPGQDRFWFLWDELAQGALGAVVLVDTRRLEDSFAAVDYFERRGIPFAVAVNCFEGAERYSSEIVREALDLDGQVPVLTCDARRRSSARDVLVSVVEHAREVATARAAEEAAHRPAPAY